MQPLGRKPVKFPSKTDCHPPKGYSNWWEVEINHHDRKRADRREAKRNIRKEINDC